MNPEIPASQSMLSRREALRTLGIGAALLSTGLISRAANAADSVPVGDVPAFTPLLLPKLPYTYDALEPHIDARTMEIHHTKHHQAYIANANKVLEAHRELSAKDPVGLLAKLNALPEPARTTLRNNLGGHLNHTFFWSIIGPQAGGEPDGKLGEAIKTTFGSFDAFKTQFADAALKRFGSGWSWLVVTNGKLAIKSTANQDTLLVDGEHPVLGLDVWEHAYYLKYQNRRADYVGAFWNVVNWKQAGEYFSAAG